MKITKYLALPVLAVVLAACSGGGSSTSSNTSSVTATGIDPMGSLLAIQGRNQQYVYTTTVRTKFGVTVLAATIDGDTNTVITTNAQQGNVSANELGPFVPIAPATNCADNQGFCTQVAIPLTPDEVNSSADLREHSLMISLSDGTTKMMPLMIRIVSADMANIYADVPNDVMVNINGIAAFTLTMFNNTNSTQEVNLASFATHSDFPLNFKLTALDETATKEGLVYIPAGGVASFSAIAQVGNTKLVIAPAAFEVQTKNVDTGVLTTLSMSTTIIPINSDGMIRYGGEKLHLDVNSTTTAFLHNVGGTALSNIKLLSMPSGVDVDTSGCNMVKSDDFCRVKIITASNFVGSGNIIINAVGGDSSQASIPVTASTLTAAVKTLNFSNTANQANVWVYNTGVVALNDLTAELFGPAINGFQINDEQSMCRQLVLSHLPLLPLTACNIQIDYTAGDNKLPFFPSSLYISADAGQSTQTVSLAVQPDSSTDIVTVPTSIVLNSTGTFALIPSAGFEGNDIGANSVNSVSSCSVSESTLSGCNTSSDLGLNLPLGIALNPSGSYAYITNFNTFESDPSESGAFRVSQCSVSQSGSLSSCTYTGSTFYYPVGIAINNSGTFALVANYETSEENYATISTCSISESGALVSCFNNPQPLYGGAFNISINQNESQAFITTFTGVTTCGLDGSGALGTCESNLVIGNTAFPYGITLNSDGVYAYLTSLGESGVVYQCNVTESTLDNCEATGSNLVSPTGIALNSLGTVAFITNASESGVSSCEVNESGALVVCN